jgi:hypothetical protein
MLDALYLSFKLLIYMIVGMKVALLVLFGRPRRRTTQTLNKNSVQGIVR